MVHMYFLHHLIAFSIGVVIFGTKGFTAFELPTILIGGYIGLVIYHGLQLVFRTFSNLFTWVAVWFLPLTLPFILAGALIYGLVVSVPKAIISIIHFTNYKREQRALNQTQTL